MTPQSFVAPRALCNDTYSHGVMLVELCAAQGITGASLMANPNGVGGTVEELVPANLEFYSKNEIPITLPINLQLQVPNTPYTYDVGMVWFDLNQGVLLKNALK